MTPAGDEDVVITLPAASACGTGALCSGAGVPLAETLVGRVRKSDSPGARLGSLELEGIALSPEFDPETFAYRAAAPGSASVVTVAAAAAYSDGAVSFLPQDADAGVAGHQVALGSGETTLTARVTAGSATQDYTVTVSRRERVTLALGRSRIDESGADNSTTLTAALGAAAGTAFTLTVTAQPAGVVALSGTTISFGETARAGTETLTITAVNDNDIEADATVTLAATVSAGAPVAEPPAVTLTVANDDLPQVTIAAGSSPVTEGTVATFELSRTGPVTSPLTVQVAVSEQGSVIRTSGNYAAPTSAVFPAGSRTATVAVQTAQDFADEENGSVTVALTAGAGYELGAGDTATVAVHDDDETPVVTIAPWRTDAVAVGTVLQFTLSRTELLSHPLTVAVAVSEQGSFIKWSDGYAAPTSAGFAAGSATTTLTVRTEADAEDGDDGSVTVAVSDEAGYAVGTPGTATVTVEDHLPFTASITAPAAFTIDEDDVRQPFDLTIEFSDNLQHADMLLPGQSHVRGYSVVGGRATAVVRDPVGQDQRWKMTVTPQRYGVLDEVVVTLDAGSECGYGMRTNICSSRAYVPLARTVTARIRAPATPAARLGALALGGVDLSPAFDEETFSYTASVAPEMDVVTVTAAAAYSDGSVEILPADADADADGRQVALGFGMTPITATVTAGEASQAYTVTVTRRGAMTLALSRTGIAESGTGNSATLTAALTEPLGAAAQVQVAATPAGAVQLSGTTIRFEAHATAGTETLTITAVDDDVDAEDVVVTLSGTSATAPVPAAVTLTVADDDLPRVTVAPDTAAVPVGTPAAFTLRREGVTAAALTATVTVTVTGSLIKTSDGYRAPTSAVFAAGSATAALAVETEQAAGAQPSGSVTVTVTAADDADYRLGSSASASATVAVRPQFSASFLDLPAFHSGSSFTVAVEFSADLASYRNIVNAVRVTHGKLTGQGQIDRLPTQYNLHIKPTGGGEYVTVTLPAATSCPDNYQNLCSAEGVPLGNTLVGRIRRSSSPAARLSALEVRGAGQEVAIVPPFAAGTFAYTADVPGGTDQVTVRATAAYSDGSVTYAPDDADTGTPGHQVELDYGANEIGATVTAGTASQAYTVAVSRFERMTFRLSATQISESGSGNSATLTAALPKALAEALTVTVTAAPAELVTLSGTTISFAANQTAGTETLTITAVNDTLPEDARTVTLSGEVSDDRVVVADVTLTVADDMDLPEVTIASGLEETVDSVAVGTLLPFELTRNGITTEALTVQVAVSEDGTFIKTASDYAAPTSAVFEAGSTTASLTVATAPADDEAGAAGSVTVTVTENTAAYRVGDPGSATVTVTDHAPFTASFYNRPTGGWHTGSQFEFFILFTAVLNHENILINAPQITNGTRTGRVMVDEAGTPYEGDGTRWKFLVRPNDEDEDVVITLPAPTYCPPDPRRAFCSKDRVPLLRSATITVESPPHVSIAAAGSPVTEGADAVFSLTRTKSPASGLTVKVAVAQEGEVLAAAADYESPVAVVFAANSATATLAVATEADTSDERDGVITATVDRGSIYKVGSEAEAAVTVADDDDPAITGLAFAGAAPATGYYRIGDVIEVQATFGEQVAVSGQPTLALTVGDAVGTARYASGTGTRRLKFRYRVADGDADGDGVSVAAGSVQLPSGAAVHRQGDANVAAELTHPALAADAQRKVDGVRPAVTAAAVTVRELVLTWSEALDGTAVPAAEAFAVRVAGSDRAVSAVTVAATAVRLVLSEAVAATDEVTVAYTLPAAPGAAAVRDLRGNAAASFDAQAHAVSNATAGASVVTLKLAPAAVSEQDDAATGDVNEARSVVTATVQKAHGAAFTVTVAAAPVAPAVAGDYTLSGDTVLSFAADATAGSGALTITAVDNTVNAVDRTVTVTGTVSAPGVAVPGAVELTLANDELPVATANLRAVGGNGQARLSWEMPAADADISGHEYRYRTVTGGPWPGTWNAVPESAPGEANQGSYTISGLQNGATYQFQVRAVNRRGRSAPREATSATPLEPPRLALRLQPARVAARDDAATATVNETQAAVTATLTRPVAAAFTLTVAAAPVPPAATTDYTMSANPVLSFAAQATESTGTVTITARDDGSDSADRSVKVTGTVASAGTDAGVVAPGAEVLTITDDDLPLVTVAAGSSPVTEGTAATFTLRRTRDTAAALTVTVQVTQQGSVIAVPGDYASPVAVTIAAGADSAGLTVATAADTMDEPDGAVTAQVTAATDAPYLVAAAGAAATVAVTDDEGPAIAALAFGGAAPGTGYYRTDDTVEVVATFGEAVAVSGTPALALTVGSGTRTAGYAGGTGTRSLTFGYRVAAGDADGDGASVAEGSLALPSGATLTRAGDATVAAALSHPGLAADAARKVDGVRPTVAAASVGERALVLTWKEALDGAHEPAAGAFAVTVAGAARSVREVAVSGTELTLLLSEAVTPRQVVTVAYTRPAATGATVVRDAAGNAAESFGPAAHPVANRVQDAAQVTLVLTPATIAERDDPATGEVNEAESVVTATLQKAHKAAFAVTVSAAVERRRTRTSR